MLRAGRVKTKTSAGGLQSLVSGPRTVAALAAVQRVSSMHKADAALRGNRPVPTTNSCIRSEDEGHRRKCSQFLELIGSVVVAVPADYTRYEPNVCYMEMAREIVKNGSAARHHYGRQLAPRSPDLAQFTKPATDDFNTLGNQPFRFATVIWL
jgi:hypothetical protein